MTRSLLPAILAIFLLPAAAQQPRYVIADQDASGPGGSDMAALLVFLQSPQADLLGITVVAGDQYRDVEVAHTLRLLELMGRTDVHVYPGAPFPSSALKKPPSSPPSSTAKSPTWAHGAPASPRDGTKSHLSQRGNPPPSPLKKTLLTS